MALSKYAEQYVRRFLGSGIPSQVATAKSYLASQGLKAEDYGYVDPEVKARQAAARQKIADDKAALAEANRIAKAEAEAAYLAQQEEAKVKREAGAARQKVGMVEDFSDLLIPAYDPNTPIERPPEDDTPDPGFDDENVTEESLNEIWRKKTEETTRQFQRMLDQTTAGFVITQINMLRDQVNAGAATIKNPLTSDSFISGLGFDISAGVIPDFFTGIFGDNDTISAYEYSKAFNVTKEQFSAIPAQAQRITAETPAMRELFKDQDYKATPFELEDAVLNGKTAEEVAEYVDPRYVTEAEAIAAFEAENGYRPSAEEVRDRIGQAEYDNATDAAGQEAYVNRTANHEQAELDDLKTYVDQRQITVDEVKDYAAQNGLTISDEEAKKLARQGSLEEILDEGQKIFDDFDERFVTRAELEGIARDEGYDPASLTEEDYAEFSGETSQSDAVKAIDTRATTEEELVEVFEQRTGIALDPYNPEDRKKLKDMMEAATAANGGVVPSDAEFKAWTKKNIEYDLGVQVGRLATGVRNAIFGTGPGGRPKTLQEILDEMLGPPGTAGFGGKSPLVIKTTPGGAIGAPSTGVFGSPNVQVEIKFPVPLPVNGPPIIVPLYEEGVYVGPSSVGELLVGEDGVITQVKDNVTTTVGRISGQVVQVVGAAGEVVKAIPLGALDNPGWREGDPNPNDLVLDESGSPALIDENGNPLDKETGLPVYEDPDDADANADNTFDLEDQDGDGIPDAIDPEVTVVNGEDPVVSRSPYEDGSASDAFRNSSWPDPDPDPASQDTYSRQIEQMFLDYGLDTNQWPENTALNISGVDANEDGVYTREELAAVGITPAAGYDPRMFLSNDSRLVLDTLEGTLDGLGLDVGEIETILGRIETDLQNVTTAEDLETFRTNLVNELLDPETGLPSMGIDEDELGDALEPITKAVDDLEGAINDVGRNVGLRAVEDDPNTPDVDESRPATGLYDYIDDAVETVEGDVEAIVGVPDIDEETGELTKDSTGLYLEFYNAGVDYDTALGLIGNKDEGTGLYGYIDDAVEGLATTTQVTDIQDDVTTLVNYVGVPPSVDADGNVIPATGLHELLINNGVAIDALPGIIEGIVGVPEFGVDDNGNPTTEIVGGTGIYGEVFDLNTDVDTVITSINDTVIPQITEVAGFIGEPATVDEDGNVIPATGLHKIIEDYAGDSELRDGKITDAINAFTSDGAYTIEQVLTAIDDSNTDVKNFIGSPGADVDDPNTPEDETLPTGIYEGIATSEGVITDAIATSEENTTAYLDYISQVIGIPATELTQADIDTVVGLIGEDEAITELNNDNRLYDVNFDGLINDADIGILQGYIDVGVEGVGEIPATGLYLDAANRDLELKGFLNDQEEVTRGLISSEADTTRGLMGAATFFNALMGAGDLSGTRVDVSTPDPARINYMYDFEDIFATPQQKSLFPSPYGKPQMAQQQQMAQRQGSTSGPLQIGGMAQGGKVDYDFTDEIMQIMRYGDN